MCILLAYIYHNQWLSQPCMGNPPVVAPNNGVGTGALPLRFPRGCLNNGVGTGALPLRFPRGCPNNGVGIGALPLRFLH